jgi:hypothetical protein
VPVRVARVPEEESRKWCGHSCWPMYHAVNNNNNRELIKHYNRESMRWSRGGVCELYMQVVGYLCQLSHDAQNWCGLQQGPLPNASMCNVLH